MSKIITINAEIMGTINFSMQQNYVPIIRSIVLENNKEEDIKHIKLKVNFEPLFAKPFEQDIDVLNPSKPIKISPVKIIMNTEYLASLTEKIVGNVHFEILDGDERLVEEDYPIELLSYEEWAGLSIMPEMLAAFVTPNHPLIKEALALGGSFLQKWNNSPSFDGYQSGDPNIVKKQMAAIYEAFSKWGIAYNMPPASYESGQRIRLPHTVLSEKAGTCLDLAVLYASALEAAGLYPLITIISGHAFAGAWLEEITFSECVEEDVTAIKKHLALEEMCVVECTDFVAGKDVQFDSAAKHGADNLLNEASYLLTIDIKRTRGSGIRPIPVRIYEDGKINMVDYGAKEKSSSINAPKEINLTNRPTMQGTQKEITKQQMWERKLLDLSLRNSLINFKQSKTSLKIVTANLGELEDALSDGKDFTIMEFPTDVTNTLMDSRIFSTETDKDLIENIAQNEFINKRIRTFLTKEAFEKQVKQLYRQARTSLEENGTNTLYLALGFLKWLPTDNGAERYAPIVLIPIEIERKIQSKSYTIHIRDEEVQMNITLLEMLRQDYDIAIPSLDPLPTDEHGINLPLVFHTIRRAVIEMKGWDIVEISYIGLFSFSQFIMWNDIHNRADDLRKNKVVASLMSGKMEWEEVEGCTTAEELDEKIAPSDMAIPVSADSSQIEAVVAAAKGQSFVLHGAPGTGKSQTITNMIANALYQGKSVVFVAEKMAALEVVQNRLDKIGLAPFCLELHSNKSQKKEVLNQLERTLNYGKVQEPADYKRVATDLHTLRTALNEAVNELHQKRPFGMSIYEAICKYERLYEHKNKIHFSLSTCEKIGNRTLQEWDDEITKLLNISGYCGGYKNCEKFYLLQNPCISVGSLEPLFIEIEQYVVLLKQMEKCIFLLSEKLGIAKPTSYSEFQNYYNLFKTALPYRYLSEPLIQDNVTSMQFEAISKLIELSGKIAELDVHILADYEYGVMDYPAVDELIEWKKSEEQWIFTKGGAQKKILSKLNIYKKGKPYEKDDFVNAVQTLIDRKKLNDELNKMADNVKDLLGGYWNGEHTNWNIIANVSKESAAYRTCLREVNLPENDKERFKHFYCNHLLLQDFENTTDFKNINAYISLFEKQMEAKDELKVTQKCDFDKLELDYIKSVTDVLNSWKSYETDICSWSNLLKRMNALEALGAGEVVEAYCNDSVPPNELKDAVECNICYALAKNAITKSPTLSNFFGTIYETDIEKYVELVKHFEELTKRELCAKLSLNIPSGSSQCSNELSTLQKAIKNGGRMLSIRKLFETIPTLLRQICPCMLMSPMSVAQYIDPSFPKFDLVIFDEASQMPTCEAVGAIARGENVIVVGDPRQLPPTSFFSGNKTDEENYDKEDLESVLDDCLALQIPQKRLLWHYRSRHESLIAFSNSRYYDNKLYTFPSPNDLVSEVKWVHVDGFYDKGGTRQNKAEGEAVVNDIVRRLRSETLRNDSIGVVTFSSTQKILIDELLVSAFQKFPELEIINKELSEPIIIKNIENVQGDERDVILFSVGYGPDENGKVSMNFGPLNNDGGWRRLNVAITRARKEMVVFSTIRAEQIDLKKTRSDGVAGLKGFLEFAALGKSALIARYDQIKTTEYNIEDNIAAALVELGYSVEKEIGASEFKVDIGIINPFNPSTFLLGIICDGKNYEAANTSRDRNIVQPEMLQGLGWTIFKVWTIEWLTNQKNVLERLVNAIEQAKIEAKAALETVPISVTEATQTMPQMNTADVIETPNLTPKTETADVIEAPNLTPKTETADVIEAPKLMPKAEDIPKIVKPLNTNPLEVVGAPTDVTKFAKLTSENEEAPYKSPKKLQVERQEYVVADIGIIGDINAFYDEKNVAMAREALIKIIEMEAPICSSLLGKRLITAFGISRKGSKVELQIENIVKGVKLKSTRVEGTKYYWGKNQDPNNYNIYRIPDATMERRNIEDITPQELANIAIATLEEKPSLNLDELTKEMSLVLGYNKITETMLQNMKRGIRFAEKDGRIIKANKVYSAV